uniref:DUF2523 family protein n=1 Tax=Psychrobacter sp. TaxID=56811 RepID=UPI00159A26EC|nr:DUF2523 family protein [Psychrobacter sp.]QJS05423.1 putative membrane protein [Psychrobacter sp.]
MGFFTKLQSVLFAGNKSWLAQILTGAGLGLVTMGALTGFVEYYKANAIANLGQLGLVSGILGLSGLDTSISIIIGSYLAGVYIKTFAAGLKVIKK